jgi:predicted O-methyltransferase YrrM
MELAMSQSKPVLDPGHYRIPEALDARLAALWSHDHAAVDGPDLAFLHMCLSAVRPGTVVEIGTATGLSTGALADMQAGLLGAPGHVRTYDLRDRLWFDESREVGCLIGDVLGEDQVEIASGITSLTGTISAYAAEDLAAGTVDFAFVDANHQHPWPILDTLMLLPAMRSGALIAHHDLQLYLNSENNVGQGPKILFDQLAETNRFTAVSTGCAPYRGKTPAREVHNNIFALRVPEDISTFGLTLSQGLALPWSLSKPMTDAHADQIRSCLRALYPPKVAARFDMGLARDRHRWALQAPAPRRGLRDRIVGRLKRLAGV